MELHIESFEGSLYLAEIVEGKKRSRVLDGERPKRFTCLMGVKEYFAEQHFDRVFLEQNSAFDEMCGQPPSNNKMQIELHWR